MTQADIDIRRARDLQDYQACVDLQKTVWGFTESVDVAPLPLLLVGSRLGGNVLVAQQTSGRYIGFAYALLARQPAGQQIWWSHMTAVLPEFRNQDVGLRLKLRQREEALNDGIAEIHWTFDPLQSVNGHFNISKLGAIARHYEENIYGRTSSALHHGLSTDRLVAEWILNSDRVLGRVDSASSAVVLRDLDRILCVNRSGTEPRLNEEDEDLLIEIPSRLQDLSPSDITRWQENLRTACRHYFKRGYVVTDFIKLEEARKQAFYVLTQSREPPSGEGM